MKCWVNGRLYSGWCVNIDIHLTFIIDCIVMTADYCSKKQEVDSLKLLVREGPWVSKVKSNIDRASHGCPRQPLVSAGQPKLNTWYPERATEICALYFYIYAAGQLKLLVGQPNFGTACPFKNNVRLGTELKCNVCLVYTTYEASAILVFALNAQDGQNSVKWYGFDFSNSLIRDPNRHVLLCEWIN